MEKDIAITKTLDIKGLSGRRPCEVTGHTLKNMAKGQILRVVSDDAETRREIPRLCGSEGYGLLSIEEDRGIICFIILR